MTEPRPSDISIHEVATLLPWYVNGTLSAQERQTVVDHLQICSLCRDELADLQHQREVLKGIYACETGPSRDLFPTIVSRVQPQTARASVLSVSQAQGYALWIENWLRALLTPRWVPALALLLLVAQSGALLWVMTSTSNHVTERAVPMQGLRVTVLFQQTATEEQIRKTVHAVNGRIVDGPSSEGVYTLEVPQTGTLSLDQVLKRLETFSDIVRIATPAKS